MAHDQYDNAARVRRLGAGETLHFARVNAARLTTALRTLLASNRFADAAAALAPRVTGMDGGERAAELIASLPASATR